MFELDEYKADTVLPKYASDFERMPRVFIANEILEQINKRVAECFLDTATSVEEFSYLLKEHRDV